MEIFRKLQETQEERIILEVGNQQFHTSRVTLRADPHSLFAMLFRKGCPFRPSTSYGRPTYYFDRDSAHFRFILSYLKNWSSGKRRVIASKQEVPIRNANGSTIFPSAGSSGGHSGKVRTLCRLTSLEKSA